MRRSLSLYLIGILWVLQASIATPTKVVRDTRLLSNLRQTTREEIQRRHNSRAGTLYKRQSPSEVPIAYGTYPKTYSDLSVARYPATDIIEGDVSPARVPMRQS